MSFQSFTTLSKTVLEETEGSCLLNLMKWARSHRKQADPVPLAQSEEALHSRRFGLNGNKFYTNFSRITSVTIIHFISNGSFMILATNYELTFTYCLIPTS